MAIVGMKPRATTSMWQAPRAVGAIRADTALRATAVMPAEPYPFVEQAAVIIPAPRSLVPAARFSVKGSPAANIITALMITKRRPSPRSHTLRPTGTVYDHSPDAVVRIWRRVVTGGADSGRRGLPVVDHPMPDGSM